MATITPRTDAVRSLLEKGRVALQAKVTTGEMPQYEMDMRHGVMAAVMTYVAADMDTERDPYETLKKISTALAGAAVSTANTLGNCEPILSMQVLDTMSRMIHRVALSEQLTDSGSIIVTEEVDLSTEAGTKQ